MNRNIIKTAAGALTLGVLLASCGNLPPRPGQANEEEQVEKRFNIKTAPVTRQELSSYIVLSGDVEASGSIDVYPSAAGKVVSLPVSLGDYVRKDQILGQVDPSMPGLNYAASPVKAPISGTVTAVNMSMGQTVSQQMPVVTIGQLDELEIKTQVPERFIHQVAKGQKAVISSSASDRTFEARVTEISPVLNQSSRTMAITPDHGRQYDI